MAGLSFPCPFCSEESVKDISSVLHYCRRCGIVFNSGYTRREYTGDYFLDEYKKQYGKTYREDFNAIYAISSERIKRILILLNNKDATGLSLLDIGSAMGFFLQAARDAGIDTLCGIEISEYAAQYSREKLQIETLNTSFDKALLNGDFAIITAWFFIEHVQSPRETLERIYSSLNDGGVFAFSVPSIFGPLYWFNRDEWIKSHPADHYTDFSPSSIKRILKCIGFRKVRIVSGGIHPERAFHADSPLYSFLAFLYRHTMPRIKFSDTIEVYALK